MSHLALMHTSKISRSRQMLLNEVYEVMQVCFLRHFPAQIPSACKYGTDTTEAALVMKMAVQEFLVLLHVWQNRDSLFPYWAICKAVQLVCHHLVTPQLPVIKTNTSGKIYNLSRCTVHNVKFQKKTLPASENKWDNCGNKRNCSFFNHNPYLEYFAQTTKHWLTSVSCPVPSILAPKASTPSGLGVGSVVLWFLSNVIQTANINHHSNTWKGASNIARKSKCSPYFYTLTCHICTRLHTSRFPVYKHKRFSLFSKHIVLCRNRYSFLLFLPRIQYKRQHS